MILCLMVKAATHLNLKEPRKADQCSVSMNNKGC